MSAEESTQGFSSKFSSAASTALSGAGTALLWCATNAITPGLLLGASYIAPSYSNLISGVFIASQAISTASLAAGASQHMKSISYRDSDTGHTRYRLAPVPREESIVKALSTMGGSAACHYLSAANPLTSCAVGSAVSSVITPGYMYVRNKFKGKDHQHEE